MAITNRRLEVYEVFELIEKTNSKKERIEILKKHESWALKDVLRGTFDKNIQWNLPKGSAPYTPNNLDAKPASFHKRNTRLKYFVKGVVESENMSVIKRERMFLEILETVHPEDAKLLVSMINKKSPVKGLTENLIKEAYPGLIRD